jgi:hypothetical protein
LGLYPIAGSPQEIDLGPVHPQDCEACQREQQFRLHLSYRWEHVYFVFGRVRRKSYLLVCEVCQAAYRIPPAVALRLAGLDSEPIPFLHQYGCLLLWAAITILAIFSFMAEAW